MHYDGAAALFLSLQHRLFYIVMSLARFNLYANSYTFLLMRARGVWHWYVEVGALLVFWTCYGAVVYGTGDWKTMLAYVLVSHVVSSPLHVQVHFSLGLLSKPLAHRSLPDCPLPLLAVDRRLGPTRIISSPPAAYHYRRRMPTVTRIHPWRFASAGHAPPFPASTTP